MRNALYCLKRFGFTRKRKTSRVSFCLLVSVLVGPLAIFAQNTGDYQSKRTGIWRDTTTWETYNGTSWVDASTSPTDSNGVITIKNGDTVTVDVDVVIDQIIVATGATLTVDSATLFIKTQSTRFMEH